MATHKEVTRETGQKKVDATSFKELYDKEVTRETGAKKRS